MLNLWVSYKRTLLYILVNLHSKKRYQFLHDHGCDIRNDFSTVMLQLSQLANPQKPNTTIESYFMDLIKFQ